ncbi:helix-turn-helix domain-containing protein [Massilia sp. G4R7]|uniref:Helix-turn-helix domain-containing protein n=1 Tax=Massilia phyllostachyos TaxID=2898585 RepID=A0ABS8Q346_9BURK|nr:helix-turn-helix transcriptional regulator [Massilia phyllostachyos]MCD2515512.1 helix-turn-helix domain-containing protein [Massilia phyllostachyos]
MNLGKAIQTSRQRRRLSQEALAKLAGCSVSYLSMLENSKRDPTISTVEKIAAALKVPVEILFFLAAEKGELAGINKELAGQLALTALELLDEKAPEQ